jgi:hypothetical protein
MPLTQGQGSLTDETSPAFDAGKKFSEVEQSLLWNLLQEDPHGPSRALINKFAQSHIPITVSLRHLNPKINLSPCLEKINLSSFFPLFVPFVRLFSDSILTDPNATVAGSTYHFRSDTFRP